MYSCIYTLKNIPLYLKILKEDFLLTDFNNKSPYSWYIPVYFFLLVCDQSFALWTSVFFFSSPIFFLYLILSWSSNWICDISHFHGNRLMLETEDYDEFNIGWSKRKVRLWESRIFLELSSVLLKEWRKEHKWWIHFHFLTLQLCVMVHTSWLFISDVHKIWCNICGTRTLPKVSDIFISLVLT